MGYDCSRVVHHVDQQQQECVDDERWGYGCRYKGGHWTEASSTETDGVFRFASHRADRHVNPPSDSALRWFGALPIYSI